MVNMFMPWTLFLAPAQQPHNPYGVHPFNRVEGREYIAGYSNASASTQVNCASNASGVILGGFYVK